MEKNKVPMREILALCIGEVLVAAAVCIVFLILGEFDYTVPLGAMLGVIVTVLNFVVLCISVNRAIDKYLGEDEIKRVQAELEAERDATDTDEENDAAARFARENQMKVQNAVKLSYIVRMIVMVGALVASALVGVFNLIATVIPLLMFRPILSISEMIKGKEK